MGIGFQKSVLGTDIYEENDYLVSSKGDLAVTSGIKSLLYRIDRMLITSPGQIFHRPDFGIGILDFQNQLNSANNIAKLRNRILKNVSQDEDVKEVTGISIRSEEDKVIVNLSLIAKGGVEVSQDFGFKR